MDVRTNKSFRKNVSVSIPLSNNVVLDASEKRRSAGMANSRMNWNSNYLGPSVDFKMMSRSKVKSDDVALKEEKKQPAPPENFDSNFPVLGVISKSIDSKPESISASQPKVQNATSIWANTPASLLELPAASETTVVEPKPELETLKMLIPKASAPKQKPKPLKYSSSLNGNVKKSPVRIDQFTSKSKPIPKNPGNSTHTLTSNKPPIKPAQPTIKPAKPSLEIVTKVEAEKEVDPYFLDSDPAWDEDGSEGASTSMSGSTILGSLDGFTNHRADEVLDSWDDYEAEDMTVVDDAAPSSPILKDLPSKSAPQPVKSLLEPYNALFKFSKSLEKEEAFLQRLGWNKNVYYGDNVNESEFVISPEEVTDVLKSVKKV